MAGRRVGMPLQIFSAGSGIHTPPPLRKSVRALRLPTDYRPSLHYPWPAAKVLGLFIPLIVTNCAILGRAEAFASKQSPVAAMFDGLMMGLGFTLALVLLGALREVLGSGTLFANASLLLGQTFAFLELELLQNYRGFLLVILPPGGFLVLGFLLVGKRLLDDRIARTNTRETATSIKVEADAVGH